MVQSGVIYIIMARKPIDTDNPTVVRASVSFPEKCYDELEKIATENRVSVAWVVREAVIEYLADKKSAKAKTVSMEAHNA